MKKLMSRNRRKMIEEEAKCESIAAGGFDMPLKKRIPYRNKAILKSAKGEDCTMNSPLCNYNPYTVVFCHLNYVFAGKGKGQKADDYAGFYGCSGCHRWFDEVKCNSNDSTDQYIWKLEKREYAFRAMTRTWRRLLDKGVLK